MKTIHRGTNPKTIRKKVKAFKGLFDKDPIVFLSGGFFETPDGDGVFTRGSNPLVKKIGDKYFTVEFHGEIFKVLAGTDYDNGFFLEG